MEPRKSKNNHFNTNLREDQKENQIFTFDDDSVKKSKKRRNVKFAKQTSIDDDGREDVPFEVKFLEVIYYMTNLKTKNHQWRIY